MKITDEMVTAAVLALAHHNVAPDIQGMLVNGNDKNRIKSGALQAALTASLSQCEQEPVGYQTRFKPAGSGDDMWSDWRFGRDHFSDRYDFEQRELYTHPTDVRAQTIRECAEVVRKLIPHIHPEEGPVDPVHEAEYSALGGALQAIRDLLKEGQPS